jgi:hypothetical protein
MKDYNQILATFEQYSEGTAWGEWDMVNPKLSKDKAIHGMLRLIEWLNKDNIISGSEHDVIYLDTTIDELAEIDITPEQIEELCRCGIYVEDDEYLAFFS